MLFRERSTGRFIVAINEKEVRKYRAMNAIEDRLKREFAELERDDAEVQMDMPDVWGGKSSDNGASEPKYPSNV